MERTFQELLKQRKTEADTVRGIAADVTGDERKKRSAELAAIEAAIHSSIASAAALPYGVSLKEAITTRDFPQLLYRVINDRILLPMEPEYIGQNLLSTTISVGSAGTGFQYSIPAFGYLEAKEVGETQDYPEQQAELTRNATSIAIKKYGIRVAVSNEMMMADELGLFGLHIMAAKLAMNRKKEEVIFSLFKNAIVPAFDNSQAFSDYNTALRGAACTQVSAALEAKWGTTGKNSDGSSNGTMHIFDVVDCMSMLLARNYEPTDMVINPLTWPVLARDPVLNGFYINGLGRALPAQAAGSTVLGASGPADLGRLALPWNMTMHVSPFVPVTTQLDGLAENVPYLTDIYIGCRRNGVILLQGQPLQQESYADISKELLNVRLKEYYGVGLADMGRSWVSIKNVRIDRSYDLPVMKTIAVT